MKNLYKILSTAMMMAFFAISATIPAQAGYYHDIMNPENTPAIAVGSLPATCRILADDVTDQRAIFIDCNSVQGLSTSALPGSFTTVVTTGNTAVGGTLGVTGVTTATGGLVSKTTNDLSPTFSTGITANPVSMTTIGTCTVAAVNGGTCIPLAPVSGRTISVTHFDIVATGSAATCTGVLLEDTNGTPVVVATLAAATLTNGAHNVPLTGTLGTGFGAGAGLTAAKGVQILVNGSACTTTTAFKYALTYTIQ